MWEKKPQRVLINHTHRNAHFLFHVFVAHQLNVAVFIVMNLQHYITTTASKN